MKQKNGAGKGKTCCWMSAVNPLFSGGKKGRDLQGNRKDKNSVEHITKQRFF